MTDPAAQPSRACVRGPPDGLCLDFANTRYWRGTVPPTEALQGPADLLRWGEARAVLDPATLGGIGARWQADAGAAATDFRAAITVREVLFRVFAATAAGGPPAPGDLAAFNAALGAAPDRSRLRQGPSGYGWDLAAGPAAPRMLLAGALWSAGDLLAGARLPRVRQCANPRCGWLFLDDSKSANRRWCSMTACGNRAKAHRHYAKTRAPR